MGRYFSRPRIAEEPAALAAGAVAEAETTRPRRRFGLFRRRRRADADTRANADTRADTASTAD